MGSLSNDNSEQIFAKYDEERQKRLRSDGLDQYVDLRQADVEDSHHLSHDPWQESAGERPWSVPDGLEKRQKVVIVGTGYGGLNYAVRLMMGASIRAEDILFIDTASGFGGTWYWNRYPGLMCDVESSSYMPLLEETGYMPQNRYSYGPELRQYAELVASKWNLSERALWNTSVKTATWSEQQSEWTLEVIKGTQEGPKHLSIKTEFMVLAAGPLTHPKLPKIAGRDKFKGEMFHTARWDYKCTGGSFNDTALPNLKDKKVAYIGTGATAVQVIPHLAKWSGELFVFQRTPAAVDVRGQHPLSQEQFQEIANKPGWQRQRRENMAAFLTNSAPDQDLVRDGWTSFPSYSALVGTPSAGDIKQSTAAAYITSLYKLDLPRQERIRARVDEVVHDSEVANSLKAWYHGFCKRPSNVTLVDTNGKGINELGQNGIIANGKEYEADVIIFGTGFEPWSVGGPSRRAGIKIYGQNHVEMEEKWTQRAATLHGLISREFPNLFLTGIGQMGGTVNFVHMMEILSTQAAYIIAEAQARLGDSTKNRPVVEPTYAAEEAWTMRILETAYAFAGVGGCTPSYLTAEGSKTKAKSQQEATRAARSSNWGRGILDYISILEQWKQDGQLEGLEIRSASTE